MPVRRPSSSVSSAATIRPSSRANATRSVRYSSPVVGDGRRSPIRRRSHAASIAYRPALISEIWRSSSVASLSSTIRSTVPPSLRTTRPRPVGSIASTETRAIAAWSSAAQPRAARTGGRPATSGTSPDRTRISSTPSGSAGEGGARARRRCRAARPGAPRRRAPRRRRGPPRWPASRRRAGRVPVAPDGGVEHVLDHRPAADRVEDLGRRRLHPRAEAGREDDRDRPALARPGLEGVTGSGARGIASGSPLVVRLRRRPDGCACWSSGVARDSAGGSSGGVNRRRRRRRLVARAPDLVGVIVGVGGVDLEPLPDAVGAALACACPCAAHSASVRRSRMSAVVARAAASGVERRADRPVAVVQPAGELRRRRSPTRTGSSSAISRRSRIADVISLSARWWTISRAVHSPSPAGRASSSASVMPARASTHGRVAGAIPLDQGGAADGIQVGHAGTPWLAGAIVAAGMRSRIGRAVSAPDPDATLRSMSARSGRWAGVLRSWRGAGIVPLVIATLFCVAARPDIVRADEHAIAITDAGLVPAELTVFVGEPVTWTNQTTQSPEHRRAESAAR